MVYKSSLRQGGEASGVGSLNSLTGDINLTSTGGTIAITEVGQNINLEAMTGGTGTVTNVSSTTTDLTVTNPTTTPELTVNSAPKLTTARNINGVAFDGTANITITATPTTVGNLTDAGTDGIVITGGTGAVIGAGTSIAQHVADTSHNGYLSSTDWDTFNGKQPAGSYLTAIGVTTANGVSGTSSGGTTPNLTIVLGAITPASVAATGQISTISTSPAILFQNTGGGTDSKNWVIGASATTFQGYALNDAGNTSSAWLNVVRSGVNISSLVLATGTGTAAISINNSQLVTFGSHIAVEGVTSTGATGTGKIVFDTSPVFTTPNIGSATGSVSGNAGTATALQTARTIAGVSFDGTANIAIPASGLSNGVTGSGAIVLANSPTIVTGALGSSTATTQSPADNSTKLATTAYVDNAVLGQDFKQAVTVATTSPLATYVYNNGASGVGATITLVGTGAVAFDGTTLTLNMPVLVKNETSTNTPNNGIYTVTQAGAIGAVLILTRRNDFDQSADIDAGDSVFVTSGTTQGTTTWAYNGISSPTIGTTNITFAQTAGQGSFTAGNGIAINGTSIAIDTSVTVDKTTAQTLSNKTFVAPALGTPISGVATNLTGTASGLTAGAVTNATFTTALTVNTGTVTLTGNAANTSVLTIGAGAVSVSGSNTGDQTITLTGAVTGSGSGSFATTIATPGTLTVATTNSTATAHTHAITSSSAPGAAASILATDASGIIGSTGTRIIKGWFTDLTVTNAIAGSITGNAASVTTNANLTGPITSSGNATSIASQTGTGTKFVVDTSPTLITPLLGTPTSGVLTNCTGYTVGNISGLGTGIATFLATPSSANLAAAVTDETGTGVLVFATSPTLITPALGTPSALVLTNATGLVTAGINASQVTLAKIQNAVASSKLLGSGASGIGAAYSELTIGNNLSMSGTTLNVDPSFVSGAASFSTGNQAYGGFTHGLGAVPSFGIVIAICGTADAGYSVADQVIITNISTSSGGFTLRMTATTANLLQFTNPVVLNATNGAAATMTTASWTYKIVLWK